MLARLAYLLVIMIWATTPLAIKLGAEFFTPMAGLSLRTVLAFLIGSAICAIGGYAGLNIKQHWKLYLAASINLFPTMALVYMAAQYISSGLIALLFGLTPFFIALLSRPILGESALHPRKLLAIFLAAIGLVLIFVPGISLAADSTKGIALMLISNLGFSVSALWVKRLNRTLVVGSLEQALGALAFSLPGMLITWVVIFGIEPSHFNRVSLASLLYLVLFASLLGIVAYYYILIHMSVETVSLIPLLTPVLAMVLGVVVADEVVTSTMLAGAGLILFALAVHQRIWQVFRLRSEC